MSHRLVAFECIAAGLGPKIVILRRNNVVVFQCGFVDWMGVDLRLFDLEFESKLDLVMECEGPVLPYWDNAVPTWLITFDPVAEEKRIGEIKAAFMREIRAAQLSL